MVKETDIQVIVKKIEEDKRYVEDEKLYPIDVLFVVLR
jgi:hypothetical protein